MPSLLSYTLTLGLLIAWGHERVAHADRPDFEHRIAPLLAQHCLECHGATDPSGGLNLTSDATLKRGGESGPAVASRPEDSLLLQRIVSGEMPPEKNGKSQALAESDVATLRSWIASGAEWPAGRVLDPFERTTGKRAGRDWWAWQPLKVPDLKLTADTNPIDHFIGQQLAAEQMTAAPQADRRTLLRRVYFDLVGLPPTFEEVTAFENDTRADAYERVVDRLLASKHFGERWARHWLDLARFAETNGYERDAVKPHAWKYRDWVISAFNDDMPYDQFITEQLAGDEIPNRSEASVIATGFLRLGTWDDEPNDPHEYQYDRLEDLVHSTTTAFLAMTVKCARCHDHKFDAITQVDYYRIGAAFWAGPVAHRQRDWNGGPTREELGYDVLGWTDLSSQPPELNLLKKGDAHRPAHPVAPGSLSGMPVLDREFAAPPADAKTSHRRLQLAQWITNKQNPLTPRVIVNRLWQHHFGEGLARTPDNFGFLGSRPTHPELLDWLAQDLMNGDWKLKRVHKLMVMSRTYQQSSQHPQQTEYAERDAGNRLWWRAERRRLDAEQLRDAILFTSGRLDTRMGGPSFRATIDNEALEGLSMKANAYQASPPEETRRRSIYMFAKRSLAVPMMAVFDACDNTAPTGRRDVSTVAPQALTLLNNRWIQEESHALAVRVLHATETEARIQAAWKFALGRLPSASEQQAAAAYTERIKQQIAPDGTAKTLSNNENEQLAWTTLCHTLLNTNEFIYID